LRGIGKTLTIVRTGRRAMAPDPGTQEQTTTTQTNDHRDPALANSIQKTKPIMPIEISYAIALFMMRM
jgi:hypothetical protein